MRIVVVGTIVADTIEAPDGSIAESLGGIAHTVSALSAIAAGGHTIVPLCRVGADCRRRIEDWAAKLPGVSLEALLHMAEPNPCVELSYVAAQRSGERIERLSHAAPPLADTDIEAASGADLVIVNCISGNDCTAAAMSSLGAASRRLYLDVHSLALATAPDGTRSYRRRDDWWSWLACADVVQCNLVEAATICGLDPVGAVGAEAAAALECLLRESPSNVLADGAQRPGVWLLTLGADGAMAFDRSAPDPGWTPVPAPAIVAVDPTGAGDAFGAGYVCAWLAGQAPVDASAAAVRSGSAACTSAGVPSTDIFRAALAAIERRTRGAC